MPSPRFYFSFRSPYSWIASRLLREKYDMDQFELEYVPTWEPDKATLALLQERGGKVFYHPMSREKHLYVLQDIKRLATHHGYRLAWPVDQEPWWELPNLAYLYARKQGKGCEFFRHLYRIRWEEGCNICSSEVIQSLADELDLDKESVLHAPENPELRREGAEALLSCYRQRVFGVPFFIVGHEKFWGVDRIGLFVAALQNQAKHAVQAEEDPALEGIPQEVIDDVGAYEADCPGGCG